MFFFSLFVDILRKHIVTLEMKTVLVHRHVWFHSIIFDCVRFFLLDGFSFQMDFVCSFLTKKKEKECVCRFCSSQCRTWDEMYICLNIFRYGYLKIDIYLFIYGCIFAWIICMQLYGVLWRNYFFFLSTFTFYFCAPHGTYFVQAITLLSQAYTVSNQ